MMGQKYTFMCITSKGEQWNMILMQIPSKHCLCQPSPNVFGSRSFECGRYKKPNKGKQRKYYVKLNRPFIKINDVNNVFIAIVLNVWV